MLSSIASQRNLKGICRRLADFDAGEKKPSKLNCIPKDDKVQWARRLRNLALEAVRLKLKNIYLWHFRSIGGWRVSDTSAKNILVYICVI